MNCWRFARVKKGRVESGFQIKFTEMFGDGVESVVDISDSSSLEFGLSYVDMCRIEAGVDPGKPWAVRGPGCDRYHEYSGDIPLSGLANGIVKKWSAPLSYLQYDVYMYISFNLFGCPYEDFSGRLNAYGRRAKKAKDQAPPPDPESPIPCITRIGQLYFLGVPEGTDPFDDITQNIIIPYGMSQSVLFAYGSENNQPYTSTGTIVFYFDETKENGEQYSIEVKGTREIFIEERYGE